MTFLISFHHYHHLGTLSSSSDPYQSISVCVIISFCQFLLPTHQQYTILLDIIVL